jgi:L-threonylcarbamoyladenylate synthase
VLDLSGRTPVILRPGSVARAEIESVIGAVGLQAIDAQAASPGTAPRHYAPRRPARLLAGAALAERLRDASSVAAVLCFDPAAIPAPHVAAPMPSDATAYAQRLYDALRGADRQDVAEIVIERPPDSEPLWLAVHDRLRRATQRVG